MAAPSEILGLFTSPQQYQQQQQDLARARAMEYAKLDPFQQANAAIGQSAYGLAGAIGGALGGVDPQLQLITATQQLASSANLSDPKSLETVAQQLASIGNMPLAISYADRAKALREEKRKGLETDALISLREAQEAKAGLPPKLTGDERYIANLRIVETKLRKGEAVSGEELSDANMSAQMLSKPRSFFDQASGQLVTNPATDPSKAFPLTFKKFISPETPATDTAGAPIMPPSGGVKVEQVTEGSLPTAVIQDVASIDKQLEQIKNREPELDKFLARIEGGQVKYDLATNAWDFGGAVIPPIFGAKSVGNQVEKDEIQRALTSRVNAVLNAAKGVQAKDDAQRAKDQIASPSTFLSSDRMASAIRDLQKAETSLAKELEVEKQTLTSKAQPNKKAPATRPSAPQPSNPPVQNKGRTYTDEEKIQLFQKANPKKNKAEIEKYLRSINQIK
jgi:hypothetical protein